METLHSRWCPTSKCSSNCVWNANCCRDKPKQFLIAAVLLFYRKIEIHQMYIYPSLYHIYTLHRKDTISIPHTKCTDWAKVYFQISKLDFRIFEICSWSQISQSPFHLFQLYRKKRRKPKDEILKKIPFLLSEQREKNVICKTKTLFSKNENN